MSQPIVVTGAAGFIAFHLISRLLREGRSVVGIDNFDPFYDPEIKEQNVKDLEAIAAENGVSFTLLRKDFCDVTSKDFSETPEMFVHLGAKAGVRPSIEDPEGYYRANVTATVRLLQVANELGVKPFVFASSSSVYGDDTEAPFSEEARCDRPISPYAATKRAGELLCANYCHLYGFRIPSLRFFTVYGPRQRPDLAIHKFARLVASGKSITMFGDGETGRDYTFVEDTVDGIRRAMDWALKSEDGSFENFNFGNSEPVKLKDLISKMETALGQKFNVERAPMQPGDVQLTYADISKSKKILGYDPKTPIDQGLKIFADWFNG